LQVRLGPACCFAALKQTSKAKMAFERVLKLDPENVDALVGLAVTEMNFEAPSSLPAEQAEGFREGQVIKALKLLERAYNASGTIKSNAMMLNLLANYYIIRRELDKAFTLAWEAFHSTSVPRMRSESCYHIARTHHIKGDYEQAGKFYEHATTIQSDFLLPHIGLGQAHFHAKKWTEAKACFDRVLR
jgi:RNA polymerase-associated protein CTR9